MWRYVCIGIGGFGGAVLRFWVKNMQIMSNGYDSYLNIIIANILGCFLFGLFLSITSKIMGIDSGIKLGITTGFLGAFTTFSTFCKDTVTLAEKSLIIAALYMTMSILLGFTAIFSGEAAAKMIIRTKEQ